MYLDSSAMATCTLGLPILQLVSQDWVQKLKSPDNLQLLFWCITLQQLTLFKSIFYPEGYSLSIGLLVISTFIRALIPCLYGFTKPIDTMHGKEHFVSYTNWQIVFLNGYSDKILNPGHNLPLSSEKMMIPLPSQTITVRFWQLRCLPQKNRCCYENILYQKPLTCDQTSKIKEL